MKIRTDFVTNSSSSSFVTIHIKNATVRSFLERHGLSFLMTDIESFWPEAEELVGVTLTKSMAESLSNMIRKYLDDMEFMGIPQDDKHDALEELIALLQEKQEEIDRTSIGEIEIGEACGEDGFGLYQKLVYEKDNGKLLKWPPEDNEDELAWTVIMDREALSEALSDGADEETFARSVSGEDTEWITDFKTLVKD